MSVLKNLQELSELEFYKAAEKLQDDITDFCLRDFGLKKSKRTIKQIIKNIEEADQKTIDSIFQKYGKKPNQQFVSDYPAWFIENRKRKLIKLTDTLIENIIAANLIYAISTAECDQRRILQNRAIGVCGNLYRELQFSKDPIKTVFMGMKQRCYNEKHIAYKHYGARGIKIYSEWLENPQSFYEWAYNNGYTKGMSIDRINANGNYEPSNCRFITMAEQQENRRINIMIEIDGEKKCLQEWCDIYHINRNTIVSRVKRNGITYEEALKQKKK